MNGTHSSTPIGYGLGPGLSGINMIVAQHANTNFLYDLNTYNILGEPIKPGATISGVVAFKDEAYNNISVKIIKE